MWHCLTLPSQSTRWVDQICLLRHQNPTWNAWETSPEANWNRRTDKPMCREVAPPKIRLSQPQSWSWSWSWVKLSWVKAELGNFREWSKLVWFCNKSLWAVRVIYPLEFFICYFAIYWYCIMLSNTLINVSGGGFSAKIFSYWEKYWPQRQSMAEQRLETSLWESFFIKYNIPSKIIFPQRSCDNKGGPLTKVLCQQGSSVNKGPQPTEVVFQQRLSFNKVILLS